MDDDHDMMNVYLAYLNIFIQVVDKEHDRHSFNG